MHDADRVIERFLIDHEPRMTRALKYLQEFAERDLVRHRDNVGARHHHVLDALFAQPENILEQRSLGQGEIGVAGGRTA